MKTQLKTKENSYFRQTRVCFFAAEKSSESSKVDKIQNNPESKEAKEAALKEKYKDPKERENLYREAKKAVEDVKGKSTKDSDKNSEAYKAAEALERKIKAAEVVPAFKPVQQSADAVTIHKGYEELTWLAANKSGFQIGSAAGLKPTIDNTVAVSTISSRGSIVEAQQARKNVIRANWGKPKTGTQSQFQEESATPRKPGAVQLDDVVITDDRPKSAPTKRMVPKIKPEPAPAPKPALEPKKPAPAPAKKTTEQVASKQGGANANDDAAWLDRLNAQNPNTSKKPAESKSTAPSVAATPAAAKAPKQEVPKVAAAKPKSSSKPVVDLSGIGAIDLGPSKTNSAIPQGGGVDLGLHSTPKAKTEISGAGAGGKFEGKRTSSSVIEATPFTLQTAGKTKVEGPSRETSTEGVEGQKILWEKAKEALKANDFFPVDFNEDGVIWHAVRNDDGSLLITLAGEKAKDGKDKKTIDPKERPKFVPESVLAMAKAQTENKKEESFTDKYGNRWQVVKNGTVSNYEEDGNKWLIKKLETASIKSPQNYA